MDLDPASFEQVMVAGDKLPDDLNHVGIDKFSAVAFAFDSGQIQDAVDVVGQPPDIVKHIPDVLHLVGSGNIVLEKRLKV